MTALLRLLTSGIAVAVVWTALGYVGAECVSRLLARKEKNL